MNAFLRILLAIAIIQCIGSFGFLQAEEPSRQVPDLRTRKTGSDWPTFLGPNGNSKSDETSVISLWPDSGLPIVWHKKIAEGYGAPSISKGRLFLFDQAGDQVRLTCLSSETGAEIWRFGYLSVYEDIYGLSKGPQTTPVIDNDRVYIFGVEGMLHCLSVLDGQLMWKLDTQRKFDVIQNFFGVGSTPVVEGDLLIAAIGGSLPTKHPNTLAAQGQLSGNGTAIVAFNKFTGEIIYNTSDEMAGYASPKVATINGRRQGFLFARGGLLGFEPRTGQVSFHYPWRSKKLESVGASNPVIAENLVFISESYGLGSSVLKIESDGYSVIWKDEKRNRNKFMELHWNTAIHHRGYLYACHGRNAGNAELRCIELETGRIAWSHKVKELSSLLYVDGHFISLGERGTLMLFKANPAEPEIISSNKIMDKYGTQLIKYPAWAAPVLSNGFLYLRGKGRVVCLDLLDKN